MTPAILALADGSLFRGISIGAEGETVGEVVFNTAITGYQEILTDPSYARQIVTLTYPHIGNTGCNEVDEESARVHAAGVADMRIGQGDDLAGVRRIRQDFLVARYGCVEHHLANGFAFRTDRNSAEQAAICECEDCRCHQIA